MRNSGDREIRFETAIGEIAQKVPVSRHLRVLVVADDCDDFEMLRAVQAVARTIESPIQPGA